MRLIDVIRNLDEAGDMTVCARRPWTAESEVCLVSVAPMSKIPEQVVRNGYEYFLEAAIIQEVLEMPEAERCSEQERVDLVIYYAENDAYPSWIYQK